MALPFWQKVLALLMMGLIFVFMMSFILTATSCFYYDSSLPYSFDSTKNWTDGVCVLVHEVGSGRGSPKSRYTYDFGGNVYKNRTPEFGAVDMYYGKKGQRFGMKVNSKDPEMFIVRKWDIRFLSEDKTAKCVGVIHDITDLNKRIPVLGWIKVYFCEVKNDSPVAGFSIDYSYIVDGVMYQRGQYLSPYLDSINKNIREWDKYEVEYAVDNPNCAILNVERPVPRF